MDDIQDWVQKVSNMDEVIKGLQGHKSTLAVNHITYSIGKNQFTLVSQFVTRLLGRICNAQFVVAATRHARLMNNPAFDGWIFEMDFFVLLKIYQR